MCSSDLPSARWRAVLWGELGHASARWGFGGLVHALALGGDLDAAEAALEDLDAEPPTPIRMMEVDIERGRAWYTWLRGEHGRALEMLRAERCEGARSPALETAPQPVALTKREREVATLAARGLTSREIAETIVVSTRTVENHLQRAYEKLGVRGRAELAEALGD